MSTATSVCSDPKAFASALKRASKYVRKEEEPSRSVKVAFIAMYVIVAVWALILALKIAPKDELVKHLALALIFPPVYIISYYLAN